MPGPHDTLIATAARKMLKPQGFIQKGRSRVWLADQRWWIVVVEFQPSGFEKGSYLNVAAHWLWTGQGYLSFDFGGRRKGFIPYQSESQFADVATMLAEAAATEASRLSHIFSSIEASSDVLALDLHNSPERCGGSWRTCHAAMAAGLAGKADDAARLFSKIEDERVVPFANGMRDLLHDQACFQGQVIRNISRQRQFLGLNDLPNPFEG